MGEIGLKCRYRLIFSLLSEDTSDLGFDRFKKGSVSFFDRFFEFGDECSSWECVAYQFQRLIIAIYPYSQDIEVLSAVQCECLVGLHARDEDREVGIYIELLYFSSGFLVQLLEHLVAPHLGYYESLRMEISSECITDLTTCGYLSRDDLGRSLDDLLSRMQCEQSLWYSWGPIQLDHICHNLPTLLDSEHGFGFFLQSVWRIDILDFLQCLRVLECLLELGCEESLFADPLYGSDLGLVERLLPPLHVDDIADLILIEITSPLLAIPRDKRYCRTFGCELEYDLDLVAFERECS